MATDVEVGEAASHGPHPAIPAAGGLPPCPSPWKHPFRALGWVLTILSGLASLALVLAVLAAIPVVNVLALGVMLEAEGRVVRSGRLRDGIPFAAALPRVGSIVIGTWFWLMVVRVVASVAADAALVDPGGPAERGWGVARGVVTALVGLHIAAAWFSGGSFVAFFRPVRGIRRLVRALRTGTALPTAVAALRGTVDTIRPARLAWLGLRGYAGAFLWLVLPTLMFSALRDTTRPGEVLVTLVGAVLLAVVLAWVPFLQARFAADDSLSAFRRVAWVREAWRRAPVAMFAALAVLYGLSLPLSLFKIFAAPRDVVFFLTPIFVVTIFPARLAVGWATAFADARPARRTLFLRLPVTLLFFPAIALYLFLLFFTPAIDAPGRRALFDHHALLLPSPF